MIRRSKFFAVFGLLLTCFAQSASAQDWRLVNANELVANTYVILTVPLNDPDQLDDVATALEADFDVSLTAEWPLASIAVHCLVFDVRGKPDLDALIAQMQADNRVRTAQLIQDFQVSAPPYPDSLFPLQLSFVKMNTLSAHRGAKGAGVTIGVVDSAIDRTHPDLATQVTDARDFVSAQPTSLAEAHGTAVAGIIAAKSTNVGIVGVAPKAKLLGLRACWQVIGAPGQCNSFSLARALNFAILNDVDVLNLSVGGPEDALLTELIEAAIAKGIIVVAAAGETEVVVFPASLDGVIAAGSAREGRIPAPMVDVISTAPGAGHRYVSGSSIATAHVSGVVALMLAEKPDLTTEEIAQALSAAVRIMDEKPMLSACKALIGLSENVLECTE